MSFRPNVHDELTLNSVTYRARKDVRYHKDTDKKFFPLRLCVFVVNKKINH